MRLVLLPVCRKRLARCNALLQQSGWHNADVFQRVAHKPKPNLVRVVHRAATVAWEAVTMHVAHIDVGWALHEAFLENLSRGDVGCR